MIIQIIDMSNKSALSFGYKTTISAALFHQLLNKTTSTFGHFLKKLLKITL